MTTLTEPIIRIQSVSKNFGPLEVLHGVDLEVFRGEVVCVIGPSGSGKSTLLRCINHLEAPTAGVVWLGDESIGVRESRGQLVEIPPAELARQRTEIGMVFQSFNLFPHMTALQNIIEAPVMVQKRPREEVLPEAHALLAKVQLSHRANAFPHQMSGGEQQRVAIARALAMKPNALLFDEVTSALDPELKGEVLAVMRQLASEGMTMISVSHEMGFVKQVADHVIFMHKGLVCEEGDPKVALEQPQTPELQSFLQKVTD
jgi:polar amino acid transport system ATP-binding protein